MTARVHLVEEPDELQALANPLRVRLLEALRSPGSAAGAARALGQPRQNINYHLKELERVGLVRKTGKRRNGNFIEALYQAVAPTIVVSPRVAWADPRRAEALRDQMSLENLILVGERLGPRRCRPARPSCVRRRADLDRGRRGGGALRR